MNESGKLILVSGSIGAGKTAFCLAAVELARVRGWDAAGLISRPFFEGGLKTAIDALDLRSGETRRLAYLRRGKRAEIATKNWVFDADVLEWGNQVLKRTIPCDILVVDEMGPLEFERQQGWLEGLHALDSCLYQIALATVRPSLLQRAQNRWPFALQVPVQSLAKAKKQAGELLQNLFPM
jgi:nucleoside-triphosphatase THEP1